MEKLNNKFQLYYNLYFETSPEILTKKIIIESGGSPLNDEEFMHLSYSIKRKNLMKEPK